MMVDNIPRGNGSHMDAQIEILLSAAALLVGITAGAIGTHKVLAPLVLAAQDLVDMIARCRSARADGTTTPYEEQMIGQVTIRFVDNLGATGSALLLWLVNRGRR